jgi:hypothetical protein
MTILTQEENEYCAQHRNSKTVPEIAKHLGRGAATIYSHFKAKKWSPFKNEDNLRRPRSHPFRAQNRKLEAYHAARQVQRNAGEL